MNVKSVIVQKEPPKKTCYAPGCSNFIAWSDTQMKWTRLCIHHLSLHRERCKLSSMRRKKTVQSTQNMYDTLMKSFVELQTKYDKLLKKYNALKTH